MFPGVELPDQRFMDIQKILTYVTQFLSREAIWVPVPPLSTQSVPSATSMFIFIVEEVKYPLVYSHSFSFSKGFWSCSYESFNV